MEKSDKAAAILRAAKETFARKGFDAVTTREIADAARVNEVTIFRRFGTKAKLFDEVIRSMVVDPDIFAGINSSEGDLSTYLLSMGEAMHRAFTANLDIIKIELMERKRVQVGKLIGRLPNEIKRRITAYVAGSHGPEAEEAEAFAVSFVAAVHGVLMNIYVLETFDPPAEFESCLEVIVRKFAG